jgi:preprotein translocase subunit SecE|tara:strand:+ start:302 stop:517 length:216 start_codon:yes stop_codon:yes gene_type:complete
MNVEKKKTNPAQFVRQVRQEMQKVTWPEKKDTFISSAIVIILVILFSLFFLVTDQIWSKGLRWIIEKGSGF